MGTGRGHVSGADTGRTADASRRAGRVRAAGAGHRTDSDSGSGRGRGRGRGSECPGMFLCHRGVVSRARVPRGPGCSAMRAHAPVVTRSLTQPTGSTVRHEGHEGFAVGTAAASRPCSSHGLVRGPSSRGGPQQSYRRRPTRICAPRPHAQASTAGEPAESPRAAGSRSRPSVLRAGRGPDPATCRTHQAPAPDDQPGPFLRADDRRQRSQRNQGGRSPRRGGAPGAASRKYPCGRAPVSRRRPAARAAPTSRVPGATHSVQATAPIPRRTPGP